MDYSFPVVFHWYSGPLNVLDRAIQKGHYFSVNPAMIQSPNGQRIIHRIPPERLLTETDGPFINIRGRVAEPTDVNLVENYLASIWSTARIEVRARVRQNFFKIVDPVRVLKQLKSNK